MKKAKNFKKISFTIKPVSIVAALVIVLALCVGIDAAITSYQQKLNEVTQQRNAARATLATINDELGKFHSSNTEAIATALLLTDAFESGGMAKAQEVFHGFTAKDNEASGYYDKIVQALKDAGYKVPSEPVQQN